MCCSCEEKVDVLQRYYTKEGMCLNLCRTCWDWYKRKNK